MFELLAKPTNLPSNKGIEVGKERAETYPLPWTMEN